MISATKKYIKGETLLRAKKSAENNLFEIWRGAKMIAKVRSTQGDQSAVITWGQCNLESALDSIFILKLENAQLERDRLDRKRLAAQDQAKAAQVARPVAVPQVLITLAPDGSLQAELPSAAATRRVVKFKAGEAEQSIKRILLEQMQGNIAIGQEGAPTKQQVWHWEAHQDNPDQRCSHCIAEGRIKPQTKKIKRAQVIAKSGQVEIRRIAAQEKRKRGQAITVQARRSIEELDL